jgi:hypothetical protein
MPDNIVPSAVGRSDELLDRWLRFRESRNHATLMKTCLAESLIKWTWYSERHSPHSVHTA